MEDAYCRLCMAEEDLTDMDECTLSCVKDDFSIEIESDDLSREICQQCHEFLSTLIEFKKKVAKTQKLLRKIVKRKATHLDKNIIDRIVINEDFPVETTRFKTTPRKVENIDVEDLTDTNVISQSPNNDELISKLIKSINLDEVEKVAEKLMWNPSNNCCTACKSKISDSEKWKKHVQSSGHLFKTYVVKKSGNADIFSNYMIGYTCPTCQKIFTSKKILSQHSRDDHKIGLNKNTLKPDTIIPKSKKNEEDGLSSEIIVKDEPDIAKAHPCTQCSRTFGFVESLQKHYRRHHKGVYFCIHCELTTINRSRFSSHLRGHYNLTPSQKLCSACFKVCNSRVDLLSHRKAHHETMLPVCPMCNLTFASLTLLKKHKRDVHRLMAEQSEEKKLLRCRNCNRSFLSLLVLEKHQCTAVKYPCVKKCGKRFDSFSVMQRHSLKCNSGTTIYSCKKCNKSFKCLNTLKVHLEKCLLRTSAPTSESTEVKIEKKLEKPSENQDEKRRESGSPLIQRPSTETNSKNSTDKKMKTSSPKCRTTLTRTPLSKKRTKTSKIKAVSKKVKKSKPKLKVKKGNRNTKKKVIIIEKNSTPIVNVSGDNSSKERLTMACEECGLVFKDVRFLEQHAVTVHSPLEDKISKTTTESHTKPIDHNENFQRSENRSHIGPLSEVPKKENTTSVWNVNWKQASSAPIDLNITQMRCIETTPKFLDLSTRRYSTPQPLPLLAVNEINERIPKQSDYTVDQPAEIRRSVNTPSTSKQKNDFDRSQTTTKDPISSVSSERRKSRWDCPYWQKTPPSTISKNIDHSKMANYNRYPVNNNPSTRGIPDQNPYPPNSNRSPKMTDQIRYPANFNRTPKMPDHNRYQANSNRTPKMFEQNRFPVNSNNPSPPVVKSNSPSETSATSTPKLLRPEYLVNQKKNDNLTIIQSGNICAICKSPESHLFCNPCCRCFLSNQVQYFNHMKMKHS